MANPRELAEQAFALMQDALRDAEQRVAQLSEELEHTRQPGDPVAQQLEALRKRLGNVQTDCERFKRETGQLEETLAAEQAKTEQLKKKLELAESGPDKLTKKEINFWRGKADQFDQTIRDYKSRLAHLRHELRARDISIDRLTQRTDENAHAVADAAGKGAEIERLRESLKEREAKLVELSAEVEHTRTELAKRSESHQRAVDEHEQARDAFERDAGIAREQIAELEQELLDEKERTDNLSEIANERRELIAQLEDRLAEAEERYEEAKWRLGKAQHFERLVRRRKGLIKALLERIRAKSKANTALKAGLDGLRKYKAASEAKQYELLARIDKLKAKIKEQEETISQHQGAARAVAQLAQLQPSPSPSPATEVAELEKRVTAQIDIIATLEDELNTAKARRHVESEQLTEIEQLQRELAIKNDVITKLQEDADAQQRKLAKLRSGESALSVQGQSRIETLEREVADLQAANAELTRSADGWRRKFEFLSTDSPDDYKSAAEQ